MTDAVASSPWHHLLISGTGRAGTSLLVRWLAAMGLETHLQAHASPAWHDDANAGLEDLPLETAWETAPYVVKSPWLSEIIDTILADPRVAVDGVIVPVRDLIPAATSRLVLEIQARYRNYPWLIDLRQGIALGGTTPGGAVFTLDPVDQARVLAVSFHHLVQRLVQTDIPLVLLDFPRFARDADYLFCKLRRFLPEGADAAQARQALADIVDPAKLRVERELVAAPSPVPTPDALEVMALRREVRRLNEALAAAASAAQPPPTAVPPAPAAPEPPPQPPESAAAAQPNGEERY